MNDPSLTSKPIRTGAELKAHLRALGAKDPVNRPGFRDELVDRLEYLGNTYGINHNLMIAQIAVETGDPSDGLPPFVSDIYVERGNPGGIGVEDTYDYGYGFTSGTHAANAFFMHLYGYVKGRDHLPAELQQLVHFDPRWNVSAFVRWAGTVKTVYDLAGKWATDKNYGNTIMARSRAIIDDAPRILNPTPTPKPPQENPPMALTFYDVPGLPGGPLPLSFPLKVRLVPDRLSNVNPGILARSPRRSVQHGNGNPNSSAAGENNYLYTGAEGRQASYHYAIDDKECWVNIQLNRVTWQAADGSGPGNMNGFSCEQVEDSAIWADTTRALRCIDHTAEVMGKTAARFSVVIPEQHWTFNYEDPNRHDCPQKLRYKKINGRLGWEIYVERWHFYRNMELVRMQGGTPVEPTDPAPTPGNFKKGDYVKITTPLNIRHEWNTNTATQNGQPNVIAVLQPDQVVKIIAGPNVNDGYVWWDVEVSPTWGTGHIAEIGLEKVVAPPKPVEFAKPLPIPELLDTDLSKHDVAPAIRTRQDGTWFIYVADVIEVTADTIPVLQHAGEGSPELRTPMTKGERFIAAWITLTDSGWWYIGPEPDWERVKFKEPGIDGSEYTKRVSDAPLIPGSEYNPSANQTTADLIDVMTDILNRPK